VSCVQGPHILHTCPNSWLATCGGQAILKWSYEKLVKGPKAWWPLPCLMRRSSGTSAARTTGWSTCHATPHTAKTAMEQACLYISHSVSNLTHIFKGIFTCTERQRVLHPVWLHINQSTFLIQLDVPSGKCKCFYTVMANITPPVSNLLYLNANLISTLHSANYFHKRSSDNWALHLVWMNCPCLVPQDMVV
jgi:hypothetical protein